MSLPLPEGCKCAVIDAARLHDLGKALPSWQEAIVRGMPGVATRLGPVAKSPALWLCKTPLPWSEEVLRSRLGLPEPTPVARLANGRWLVEVGVRPAGREVTATRAPFRP
ncbi:MAG TPA: hypothetical protein PK095_16390, partial [Myxococcota bacterium]|nr:hypothetical protein [Myxococcota bacterium]